MPWRTSRSAISVAASISSPEAPPWRSRSKLEPGEHPGGRLEAELDRVDRVEQRLLVLLHVLVVGERQRVQRRQERGAGADHARRLCRAAARPTSGFFFCGMMLEPEANGVGELARSRTRWLDQSTISVAEAREVHRAGRARRQVVEDEVAVGTRVDASSRRARRSRASSGDVARRSSVPVDDPASAPEPSGIADVRRAGEAESGSTSRASIQK